jgi:nucleoside transporter
MPRPPWPRLAGLMFVQYFVMGLWAVTLGAFLMGSPHEGGLNLSARHVGLIYSTFAIAATLAPLLVGLIADRLFATQRVLAVLHLIGAGLLGAALWWSVQSAKDVWATFERVAWKTQVSADDDWPLMGRLDQARAMQSYLATGGSALTEPLFGDRIEGLLNAVGIHTRRFNPVFLTPLPEGWSYSNDRVRYVAEFLERIQPALRRVRSHPEVTAAAEQAFPPLFALMLAYNCCFLPTLTLANALTFRNLTDPARQYAPLRALGTVGWMVAGLIVGFVAPAVSPLPFLYAAGTSVVLAVFCLCLPHTPPIGKPKTLGDALGLPALRLLAERSFFVFALTTLLATGLMPFYNSFANKYLVDLGVKHAAAVQTLAQPTEVLGALLIPWLLGRIGTKWMLLAGLVASAVRFAVYAWGSVPVVLAIGLPLHGVGFSLFYIAAAVYVDRLAPRDLRASAQGLVTLLSSGAGGILGNWFAGRVIEWHTAGGVVDWQPIWQVPALGMLAVAVMFGVLFREPPGQDSEKTKNS